MMQQMSMIIHFIITRDWKENGLLKIVKILFLLPLIQSIYGLVLIMMKMTMTLIFLKDIFTGRTNA